MSEFLCTCPGSVEVLAVTARPVLVLDDTDKWLNTTGQPEAATVRSAFLGG
jgi:hypothetical protein